MVTTQIPLTTGTRLAWAFKERGFMQRTTADKTGMSESRMSNLVHDRQAMSADDALAIGRITGVSPAWLLYGSGSPFPRQATEPADQERLLRLQARITIPAAQNPNAPATRAMMAALAELVGMFLEGDGDV